MRLAGRASGRNVVEWPSGRTEMRKGDGHIEVRAPEGAEVMTASLPAGVRPTAAMALASSPRMSRLQAR